MQVDRDASGPGEDQLGRVREKAAVDALGVFPVARGVRVVIETVTETAGEGKRGGGRGGRGGRGLGRIRGIGIGLLLWLPACLLLPVIGEIQPAGPPLAAGTEEPVSARGELRRRREDMRAGQEDGLRAGEQAERHGR